DLLFATERAIALYRQPLAWRKVQRQAMAQNFDWSESARRYLALYRDLVPEPALISDPIVAEPMRQEKAG
ncbi:MAG TPA: hypothetical protein VGP50_17085, partial [Stellaceae bacterium]|nr:hypothetical protein [Stellaceae bacterium]